MMTPIAYLGPRGTHTHQAALCLSKEENLISYSSIPKLTNALDLNQAVLAILPIENSLAGTVSATFDYLIQTEKKIIGEIVLDIEHVLVSIPGVKKEAIKMIASHPQALAQCSHYLNNTGLAALPTASTVAAINELNKDSTIAAITSTFAATIYGLDVLEENISDANNNCTRFCILGDIIPEPTDNDKTSIIFEIKDQPGSLYEILRIFAAAGINLTKIESRPAKSRLGKYLFAIDFQGHCQERNTASLLAKLTSQCIWLKVLGSYPISSKE